MIGLIYANHGQKMIEYFTKELRVNQNEVILINNHIMFCILYFIDSETWRLSGIRSCSNGHC